MTQKLTKHSSVSQKPAYEPAIKPGVSKMMTASQSRLEAAVDRMLSPYWAWRYVRAK